MTGRSPNRYIAQGTTLGVSELSNLHSERAAGGSSLAILPIPFALSERKIAIPSSPGRCPGLCSHWAFSPPLLVTIVATQSTALYFCSAFSPPFLVTLMFTLSSALYSCSAFSPSLLVTTVAPQSSAQYYFWSLAPCFHVTTVATQSLGLYFCSAFSPSLPITIVAAQFSALYFCSAFIPLLQPDGWFKK